MRRDYKLGGVNLRTAWSVCETKFAAVGIERTRAQTLRLRSGNYSLGPFGLVRRFTGILWW